MELKLEQSWEKKILESRQRRNSRKLTIEKKKNIELHEKIKSNFDKYKSQVKKVILQDIQIKSLSKYIFLLKLNLYICNYICQK